ARVLDIRILSGVVLCESRRKGEGREDQNERELLFHARQYGGSAVDLASLYAAGKRRSPALLSGWAAHRIRSRLWKSIANRYPVGGGLSRSGPESGCSMGRRRLSSCARRAW